MFKKLITLVFLLITVLAVAHPDQKKVEQALYNLKNVTFKQLESKDDSYLLYELRVRQLVDHTDPSKGYFYQKVHFYHKDFDHPMIMETNGYDLYVRASEMVNYLQSNYLNIEHRFFGESIPEGKPWQYLTMEQVTADLHEINQLFKEIYTNNKWISTGISKGGQTSIYYKYFYPNDVDVAIPYVAPFNQALEEPRIYPFLANVGDKSCRDKIYNIQVKLFENKTQILEKLKWYAKGARLSFNYLGSLEKAFEYAVLEYSFGFWQSGHSCTTFPNTKNIDELTEHFLSVSNIDFFSDQTIKRYESHYYQSGTQLGYYGYDITPFKKYVSFTSNPLATFMPEGTTYNNFNDALIQKVKTWLENDANNIIYVYGETDTWSASMVVPSAKVNSKAYVLPKKDHGQARVKNMTPEMRTQFFSTLEKMTGLKPLK
ncbi:putative secreted tripeptidyl aminopeptidase [Myroides odoratimimus]|uniref:PS-10 peptidase S37 n=1 Tax=Myroides odoratimimus CCUG 10230 TaxID=883150 RepID=A0ABP2NAP4_9FLAO|nr:S28 family serine protease [Myroides odoratimimus]EHO09128.1 hypothetical protein HMPREF9712_01909 [Myroides odoratimimus CCUG 10230]MCS7473990.1 hypothetical protein [Myroides odoratimimus]MDM1066363.1 hypothetical protein [Myroides odoratimimus]MDM1085759.1 hypothetical protein [Myroides odoratimimus]MDM1444592.1 hypothetical protein [Myroides odoratimimus]